MTIFPDWSYSALQTLIDDFEKQTGAPPTEIHVAPGIYEAMRLDAELEAVYPTADRSLRYCGIPVVASPETQWMEVERRIK